MVKSFGWVVGCGGGPGDYTVKELISPMSGKDVVFTHCQRHLPPPAATPSPGAAVQPHQPAVEHSLGHSEHVHVPILALMCYSTSIPLQICFVPLIQ